MINKKEKLLIFAGFLGVLTLLIGVSYHLYLKSIDKITDPVIVSESMFNIEQKEEDVLLQIVKRDKIEGITGLNQVIGLTDDNQIIAQIGPTREEIENIYEKYKKDIMYKGRRFETEIVGSIYKIDLNTLEKVPFRMDEKSLNTDGMSQFISPDGSKLFYTLLNYIFEDACYGIERLGSYIYDVKSNTNSAIKFNLNDYFIRGWSKDSKYVIGVNKADVFQENNILLYDSEMNSTRLVPIKNKGEKMFRSRITDKVYSKEGEKVFFLGMQVDRNYFDLYQQLDRLYKKMKEPHDKKEKKNSQSNKELNKEMENLKEKIKKNFRNGVYTQGIYKLDVETEQVDIIMTAALPEEESTEYRFSCHKFEVINDGKQIVFEGNINGKDGLFIYSVQKKQYFKVAESVGDPLVPFHISPDENKIVYAVFNGIGNNGYWTIYAANIIEDKLVNKMILYKDIEYYSGLGNDKVWWSRDSKKLIIHEEKTFDLDTRIIAEKGIIHVIYFK